jgi:hypothetical protein
MTPDLLVDSELRCAKEGHDPVVNLCPQCAREALAAARAEGRREGLKEAAEENCEWCAKGLPLDDEYHVNGLADPEERCLCRSWLILRALADKEGK